MGVGRLEILNLCLKRTTPIPTFPLQGGRSRPKLLERPLDMYLPGGFCLPLKIRIWKKHKLYLSYQEMKALEMQGDLDVIQL